MKVTFTPKEYSRLLELVWLGLQTTVARDGQETTALQRYAEIEQKLLNQASSFGCSDLVTVGSDGRLAPSEKLHSNERLKKILGNYDNDTFWHELVTRLADRDLAAEQARHHAAGKGGPPIDADDRLKQLEEWYWREFETNDLSHMVWIRGAKG